MSGRALRAAAAALVSGAAIAGCFVQPRSDSELEGLFDAPVIPGYVQCDIEAPQHPECDDGNPCTGDVCVESYEYGDVCVSVNASAGSPCGSGGKLACDGAGTCTGCKGDATTCGDTTFCNQWECAGDACVAKPTAVGEFLPTNEQFPGDCMVRVCDGLGNILDRPASDYFGGPDACGFIDCLNMDDGVQCSDAPSCAGGGVDPVQSVLGRCVAGKCTPMGTPCEPFYGCTEGFCSTSCTPESAGVDCTPGAMCVQGKCVPPPPP